MSKIVLASIIGIVLAWILGAVFTGILIPFLEKKQFRQFVREVGPQSHLSKTGTPSMGGIAIVASIVISTLIVSVIFGFMTAGTAVVLAVCVLFALIGFIDDYEKAIKKNNKGISPKQKIVMQVGFSLLFAIFAYFFSGTGTAAEIPASAIFIPFADIYVDLGIFYIPWVVFVMVAFSNAVNLTDGLDGLASGITTLVSFAMVVMGASIGFKSQPAVFACVAGACLGFLLFNKNPAKIFMGDTGSMALGGVLSAAAIMMKLEFFLAIAGLIYVIEALSVVLQVTYFKLTHGKRIFKMAPIHHHFELCGMKEQSVVTMFWIFALVFSIAAVLIMAI